jgi:hypothetical protein
MIVALYNLEAPKIHNSAMMQVSQYHKNQGDDVEIYNPILKEKYDRIYAFSLFDFTDKGYVTSDMIVGGTGFDIKKRLPLEIEICDLDYSIDPDCDYSMIWFSRGCIRHCPFCIVRDKEGIMCSIQPKNLNPNGKYIVVMDNNFFANPSWRHSIAKLKEWNLPVRFECGIDVRLFDKEQGEALNSIKFYKQIHIAWDNPRDNLVPKIKELTEYIKPYRIMCYVLIGYWSNQDQDLMRIKELMNLKIDPFVMPYDKKDRYQKDFARWCNRPEIRKTCEFKDYRSSKKLPAPLNVNKKEDGIPPNNKLLGILPNEL